MHSFAFVGDVPVLAVESFVKIVIDDFAKTPANNAELQVRLTMP